MLEMGTSPFLVILRLNLTRVKSISGDLSSSGSGCEANASCAEVSKSPRLAFLRILVFLVFNPRRPAGEARPSVFSVVNFQRRRRPFLAL